MFKPGDIVRCVDNDMWEDCLTVGKEYKVLDYVPAARVAVSVPDENVLPEVVVRDDEGIKFGYRETRFELSSEA